MTQSSTLDRDEDPWPGSIAKLLREEGDGTVAVVGIGHPLKSDDYVGSLIAKDLVKKDCASEKVLIIDAENSPENVLYQVWEKKPSVLLLIDSIDAGLPPGSIRFVDLNETTYPFFTSHNIPVELMFRDSPGALRAVLLGVQPGDLTVGGSLSPKVRLARAIIVRELSRILKGGAGTTGV